MKNKLTKIQTNKRANEQTYKETKPVRASSENETTLT